MIILTANKEYTGLFGGIAFKNGKATVEELSNSDKAWYISKGCTIAEEEEVKETEKDKK